jgi:carboxyl-terminal processing protease
MISAIALTLTVSPAANETRAQAVSAGPPLIDQVSRLVRRHFYDPAASARIWPRALEEHAASLPQDPSDDAVEAAIDAMLAELGASHTNIYTADEQAYYELLDIFARRDWRSELRALFPRGRIAYTGIGVVPRVIDGRTFLAGIYHGGPAARAGLLVGDEIVAAEGQPFDPVTTFAGRAGRSVTLEIRRKENGPIEAIEVVPARIRPNAFFLDAMRASVRVVERDGRDFGYVRIWSYARRDYHRLLIEELAEGRLKEVEGLVLDLRGGWGGAEPDYAELFVGGAPVMTYTGRDGDEDYATFRWRRPVVVLVDEGTRSGKEVIAYGLQRQGITVIGQRTAGALLAGRGFLLDDGSLLVLAVADVHVEGKRLEGVGVTPDRTVQFSIPYAAGRDPQFEAALEVLAGES